MRIRVQNPFARLTKFELCLWLISLAVVTISFFMGAEKNILNLIASCIGVTSLIFVAKGFVIGQCFGLVFCILYGIISFRFRYYGEMITYVFMTGPIALFSIIAWLKHPFADTGEVAVSTLRKRHYILLAILTLIVTFIFYFILKYFNTANLFFSTVSIATSFYACVLSLLRSPYYAVAYGSNDIVLIILWIMATLEDPSYLPMVLCFTVFLANDAYGFWSWQRMERRQKKEIILK